MDVFIRLLVDMETIVSDKDGCNKRPAKVKLNEPNGQMMTHGSNKLYCTSLNLGDFQLRLFIFDLQV